jgi:putative DNA primase/helicase
LEVSLEETGYRFTDVGNAEALVDLYGDDLRYCYMRGKWLIWDDMRWKIDEVGTIWERAKGTVKALLNQALKVQDGDKRLKAIKHAIQSESHNRLWAMIKLARSEMGVTPGMMDRDPWLFNCLNGTLDLRSGELRPHKKGDLITKMAKVEYKEGTKAERWESFLREIMCGREELVHFLQKAVGYAMTGDTREQCLFVLYGKGANGKSTFVETIRKIMMDYSEVAAPSSLMIKRPDIVRNDIAKLDGTRFVASSEASERGKMDEGLVKQMTGQDVITARFLFKDEFQIRPTWKVFLSTNYRPEISGTDYAIWRRIRLVPFDAVFKGKKCDKELDKKLEKEKEGILAWMVDGCMMWQSEGLKMPEEVKTATREYREEMDKIGPFLEESCYFHPEARVTIKDLYDSYLRWCKKNDEEALKKAEFGSKLKDREGGITSGRSSTERFWRGIALSRAVSLAVYVEEEEE